MYPMLPAVPENEIKPTGWPLIDLILRSRTFIPEGSIPLPDLPLDLPPDWSEFTDANGVIWARRPLVRPCKIKGFSLSGPPSPEEEIRRLNPSGNEDVSRLLRGETLPIPNRVPLDPAYLRFEMDAERNVIAIVNTVRGLEYIPASDVQVVAAEGNIVPIADLARDGGGIPIFPVGATVTVPTRPGG